MNAMNNADAKPTSTIHLISVSPVHSDQFAQCRQLLKPQDAVVFMGDATYALPQLYGNDGATMSDIMQSQVYVMASDAEQRGVYLPEQATTIDYDELVQLCANHTKSISWF